MEIMFMEIMVTVVLLQEILEGTVGEELEVGLEQG